MATVFMKWLETSPKDYDRGIRLLTLGQITAIKQTIVNEYIHQDMHVLEIGCGTGTLTAKMAEKGATVSAIDASPVMLAEAQKKVIAGHLQERVTLELMDATLIGEAFSPGSFDVIVSTLVFSELTPDVQSYVLDACVHLLVPDGRLLIADEVTPSEPLSRILFTLFRWPLVLVTWLLTRTTTRTLRDFGNIVTQSGFYSQPIKTYLGGSLVLYEAVAQEEVDSVSLSLTYTRLRHKVNLRTLFLDLWELFFRIIPPYPKVRPGLYRVGVPGLDSPVLVTGNFDLTVRRLLRAIDNRMDAWLLVADSKGINVWCAAGGGYFTADNVIAAVKAFFLDEVVRHRTLILPQLCANGMDGWRIRQETGWGVHWGPVSAADLPDYITAKRVKSDDMRWVRFPLKDRLEMVTVTLGFYGLLILIPVFLFWRDLFWPITASLVGLSYFYAVVHPWLPGRDGLVKSVPLTLIALSGLVLYMVIWEPIPTAKFFNWAIGLTALSVFTAAELQGMSPLMRGEQANWGWEAIIGATLGLIYWITPLALGWR